jgi:hypothetical protein
MPCPSCGDEVCQGEPICGLRYIADSPSQEFGGFHENAIRTAKQALELIAFYEAQLAFLGSALKESLEWKKANFTR